MKIDSDNNKTAGKILIPGGLYLKHLPTYGSFHFNAFVKLLVARALCLVGERE